MKWSWMVVIGLIAAVSSCPDCCTIYVILDTSTVQTPVDSCSCNITIDQLSHGDWYRENNVSALSCPQREFLFQSGIHQTTSSPLYFVSIDHVIIRGEPNTTIIFIEGWDDETFSLLYFEYTPNIKIKDVQVRNFLCRFYGVYTGDGSYHQLGQSHNVKIEVINSMFINSRLQVEADYAIVLIQDSIIANCSRSRPFFDRYRTSIVNLHMTLKNSNFTDNNSPFFSKAAIDCSAIIIMFTGHNNIARNKAPIIEINGFLVKPECNTTILFSTAKVYIQSNINLLFISSLNTTVGPDLLFLYMKTLISAGNVNIIFKHCHVIFTNNYGGGGGAIMITGDSAMVFQENVSVEFNNNTGYMGGPLYLESSSTMIFKATKSKIVLRFTNNTAQRGSGGAIYVADNSKYVRSIFDLQCSTALVTLIFADNKALLGGNQIYGGWVDWFRDQNGLIRYEPNTTKEILKFDNSSESEVSSFAIRVCLCKEGHPDCSITNTTMEIYGYTANLDLIAVGQRFTPVPALITANLTSNSLKERNKIWQQLWMKTERLNPVCTRITYNFFSYQLQADNILYLLPSISDCHYGFGVDFDPQMPKYAINDSVTAQDMVLFQQLSIHLEHHNCPIGFYLHKTNRKCVCQPSLLSLGLSCDLKSIKIHRNKHQWIGMAHEHIITSSGSSEIIVYPYCPFDYCRTDNESLFIRLEGETDHELCTFNRSGILCGGCKSNYSRVLGSSKCKECSMNFKMFAIILGWLLSGLILVILLMLLDLTISVGTINGLTFYANIIQAQRATFFTLDFSSPFLSNFIAWLNLDQGFETCLYNGLDEYTITWLQFLFPLYIWLIAAAMIVSSHHSTRISKLIGNNAVQVLATLFLISYTKLLQLIIEVFSFATLTYPDGYKKTVWLIDGNVEFLKGKHILLFLMTLIYVLFSLPYTLILFTIQFLYKISHYRMMFWVQKLKPLLDAYTGPYRDNHRYWTGLLLIARIVLLIVFTSNEKHNTSINLFVIILLSFCLVGWLGLGRSVYKRTLNNFLEVIFLLNLGLTSAAVFFDKDNTVAIKFSVILALMKLIGIIIYHVHKQLSFTRLGSELKKKASNYIMSKINKATNFVYKLRQLTQACCKCRLKPPIVQPVEPLVLEAEPEEQGTY